MQCTWSGSPFVIPLVSGCSHNVHGPSVFVAINMIFVYVWIVRNFSAAAVLTFHSHQLFVCQLPPYKSTTERAGSYFCGQIKVDVFTKNKKFCDIFALNVHKMTRNIQYETSLLLVGRLLLTITQLPCQKSSIIQKKNTPFLLPQKRHSNGGPT